MSARGVLLVLALASAGSPAMAQSRRAGARGHQGELRLDLLVARTSAAHLGAGVNAALGNYVRVGAIAGAGAVAGGARPSGQGDARLSGRVDVVGRFSFDPFFQHRWAPYAGAGVGVRKDGGESARLLLVTVIGAEGPRRGRVVPAFEVGVGGGVRIGAVLRRARPEGR